MLHTETVEPGTFALLERLVRIESLKEFCLVGGTALSLRYGHRKSDDLDLFSHHPFNVNEITERLKGEFGREFRTESRSATLGLFCYIENVKVDIIHYPHPLIHQPKKTNDIPMYSDQDIIAMKINAIFGRGKKKDFWDLYELLQHYPVADMIRFHEIKFADQNLLITIPQAMVYFDDADESEDPVSLTGQTWEGVKAGIQKKVREFLK